MGRVTQLSAEITAEALEPRSSRLARPARVELLLLGTGHRSRCRCLPSLPGRDSRRPGIVADPMATGAAARTYNILLGERRRVAVALIVVG